MSFVRERSFRIAPFSSSTASSGTAPQPRRYLGLSSSMALSMKDRSVITDRVTGISGGSGFRRCQAKTRSSSERNRRIWSSISSACAGVTSTNSGEWGLRCGGMKRVLDLRKQTVDVLTSDVEASLLGLVQFPWASCPGGLGFRFGHGASSPSLLRGALRPIGGFKWTPTPCSKSSRRRRSINARSSPDNARI